MTDEEKKQVQALVHSAHRIQTGLWLAASIWLLALAGAIGQQVARALGYTAQLPLAAAAAIIAVLLAVTAYPLTLLIQQQQLAKKVWQSLPQEKLRSTAQVADPITGVTDLGTHYLVTAPLASITLEKGPTQVEVDPQATQSTYKQQSSYFNIHRLNHWLRPAAVSGKEFLAALPEDRYEQLVNADRQADILHLTPADFAQLQRTSE